MNMLVVADRGTFDLALSAARQVDSGDDVTGMAARLDGVLLGRLDVAWGRIEVVLREGFLLGKAKAQAALDTAIVGVEKLLLEAGIQAKDIQESLLRRMQVFTQSFLEGMLARVPTALVVGSAHYMLSHVQCTQRLVVSGSIKTNLTELFTLVAEGEIEVATNYATGPSAIS